MITVLRWQTVDGCVRWLTIRLTHWIGPERHGLPTLGACAKAAAVVVPLIAGGAALYRHQAAPVAPVPVVRGPDAGALPGPVWSGDYGGGGHGGDLASGGVGVGGGFIVGGGAGLGVPSGAAVQTDHSLGFGEHGSGVGMLGAGMGGIASISIPVTRNLPGGPAGPAEPPQSRGTDVPEPAAWSLVMVGVLAAVWGRRG